MTAHSEGFITAKKTAGRRLAAGARRRARYYCIVFFLLPVIAACAVAGLNIAVDVKGLYGLHRIEEGNPRITKYVDAMVTAPFGVDAPSCCERLIKLELARRPGADCFVLGSSHELQVRGNIGGRCRSAVNLAVYGGVYEDLLTFLYAAAESGPGKTIFVGVDPWDLRRNADERWQQFAATYARAREAFGLPALPSSSMHFKLKLVANLFSLDYARANITVLLHPGRLMWLLRPNVVASGSTDYLFLSDGSFVYLKDYTDGAPARRLNFGIDDFGEDFIEPPAYDSEIVAELTQALKTVQQLGNTVVLLLTPYTPEVFKCGVRIVCQTLPAVENKVHEIGNKLGIEVIGGYDGRRFALTAANFLDTMHLTPDSVQMIFGPGGKAWRQPPGPAAALPNDTAEADEIHDAFGPPGVPGSASKLQDMFPLRVSTPAQPWAYGAQFPLRIQDLKGPLRIRIRADVHGGPIGIGILNQKGDDFLSRTPVIASGNTTVTLDVPKPQQIGDLVIQSWDKGKPADVTVDAITVVRPHSPIAEHR